MSNTELRPQAAGMPNEGVVVATRGPVLETRERRRRFTATAVVRYAILFGASVISLYPMLWVASVAMKSQAEYIEDPMGLPDSVNFTNFKLILENEDFIRYALNSILVVGITVPLLTATSVAAGYALARLWGRAGNFILIVFLFSEFVPLTILAIPLLLTVQELGIEHGIVRLVLVYTAAMMGFAVLVSRAFFRSFPEEFREAARLDGCSELQVFLRIMIPLARSPITLVAVFSFIFLWNEFFLAVVLLETAEYRTLPLGLTELRGQYSSNWPLVAAALLLSTIPTMTVYALFQGKIARQFTRSTTSA